MVSVTIDKARNDLPGIVEMILKDHDETLIVSDEGSVVLIEQGEWESIKETLRLLGDKESLAALLDGHRIRSEEKVPAGKTIDEVFFDV